MSDGEEDVVVDEREVGDGLDGEEEERVFYMRMRKEGWEGD